MLLQVLLVSLIPWLMVTSFHSQLHLHMAITLSVPSPILLLLRTLVIEFRAFLDNPGESHLNILNFFTSTTKTLPFFFSINPHSQVPRARVCPSPTRVLGGECTYNAL